MPKEEELAEGIAADAAPVNMNNVTYENMLRRCNNALGERAFCFVRHRNPAQCALRPRIFSYS